MKKLAGAIFTILMLALTFPRVADVAPVDWLGRVTGVGGAESESWRRKDATASAQAHGLGMVEAMGVIPIFGPFGAQADVNFQAGGGEPQWTGYAGPIFDWGGGKVGLFAQRQWLRLNPPAATHKYRKTRNWWITPSVSFYDLIPGTNIDIWHSQIVTGEKSDVDGKFGDGNKHLIGYSQTRAQINWFPNFIPFIPKDNLELTLGVHLNALAGPGHETVRLGVGPAFGAAVVPIAGIPLELQLFKAFIDNRNRYRVTSGAQFYFARGNPTLMQLRRMYLEPTNLPGSVSTHYVF